MIKIATVNQKAKQPRFSYYTLIYVCVFVVLMVFIETEYFKQLSSVIKLTVYLAFLIITQILGTGVTTMIKGIVIQLQDILKDDKLSDKQKLDAILNIIIQLAHLAGTYFELLNEEQFGD